MKLSEKGLTKLSIEDFEYDPQSVEFEPDDFTNCVVLTVEEAKQVQQEFLDIVCEIVRAFGYHGVKFVKPTSLIMLEERIEQSEKENDR